MTKEEESIETFNDLEVNISESSSAIQNISNWTSFSDDIYDADTSDADIIRHENSILYWFQMLGIFLGSLLALAVMTLITCRRPHKRVQIIEETIAPESMYIMEEPPNYEEVMQIEMEDLPSYTDVINGDNHYFDDSNI